MKQRIARLISDIFNPYIVSLVTIVLLVWHASGTAGDALKWAAIALVLSVVPVFVFILLQIYRKKIDSFFPEGQKQRRIVYFLSSFFAAVGCAVMWIFDAPELLTVSFIAGLLAVVVFMIINFYWKISLHTAFVSAAVTLLTLVFGAVVAWAFVLLPLVAWSRLELKMHTLGQVIAGGVLAAAIVAGALVGFGIV